jgi:hypothetical protein
MPAQSVCRYPDSASGVPQQQAVHRLLTHLWGPGLLAVVRPYVRNSTISALIGQIALDLHPIQQLCHSERNEVPPAFAFAVAVACAPRPNLRSGENFSLRQLTQILHPIYNQQ